MIPVLVYLCGQVVPIKGIGLVALTQVDAEGCGLRACGTTPSI